MTLIHFDECDNKIFKSAKAVLHSKVREAVREIRDAAVDALLEAEPTGSCLEGESLCVFGFG